MALLHVQYVTSLARLWPRSHNFSLRKKSISCIDHNKLNYVTSQKFLPLQESHNIKSSNTATLFTLAFIWDHENFTKKYWISLNVEKLNRNLTLCNVLGLQLLAQSANTSCKEHLQIKHWMKLPGGQYH